MEDKKKIQQGMQRQTEKLILIEREIDNIDINISQFEMIKNEEDIVTNLR
jgi:hypothetical protein